MEQRKPRYDTARKWLIFWTLFIGIGAVTGGLSMIIDPSGRALHMDGMLPYFRVRTSCFRISCSQALPC